MKKSLIYAAAFAMMFTFSVGGAMAEDKGPAEMTLKTAKGKKPAVFPHAAHQTGGKVTCDNCHKDLDVKKMATDKNYAHKEGCKNCHKAMKAPKKCTTCHPKKKKAIEGC